MKTIKKVITFTVIIVAMTTAALELAPSLYRHLLGHNLSPSEAASDIRPTIDAIRQRGKKMRNEYSRDIANAIKELLVNDNWRFVFNDESGTFQFNVGIGEKLKSFHYVIKVKRDEYIVYAISPISADPKDSKMMATMAEFICRASYGSENGNFELDFRDGELRYKSFVDCGGGTIPTQKIIKNSIYFPAFMFKRYTPGFLAIIFGGASAEDAIKRSDNELRRRIAELILSDDIDIFGEAESGNVSMDHSAVKGGDARSSSETITE